LNEAVSTALKILDGFDEIQIPRFGDEMKKSPPDVALDRVSLRHEDEIKHSSTKRLFLAVCPKVLSKNGMENSESFINSNQWRRM
jgi:hypothetical protein